MAYLMLPSVNDCTIQSELSNQKIPLLPILYKTDYKIIGQDFQYLSCVSNTSTRAAKNF